MSPARARTSTDAIVAAGRDILEAGGLDAVTMQAVASRVGVRAPSLYKRLPSRAALIAAIGEAVLDDIERTIEPHSRHADPAAGLRALAAAYRSFAHANPRSYALLYMGLTPDARPATEHYARAARPLLVLAERLAGPDRALEAARLVTAFANGFLSMELGGSFQLGGDVDEAYRYGVDVLADAIARPQPVGSTSSQPGATPKS